MNAFFDAGALQWGGGRHHTIRGSDATALHAREWGNPDGKPLIFIHGWTQSFMTWVRQYASQDLSEEFRIVAFDLRGHGRSEKPADEASYVDGRLWAGDVAAVIDALDLKKPVLVGSSYAGFVICDFIAHYGQDNLGAVNFVGAAVMNTVPDYFGAAFGELAPDMMSLDATVEIEAVRRFVRAYHHAPLPADMSETIVAFNMLTPPWVRQWCVSRELDFTDVLRGISVPTLVTQGNADALVRPAMSEHIVASVPKAVGSQYDDVSHAPHFENAARFNLELAALARST